ncbi:MAG: phosphate ABC transporter substrate-binding protein [Proteobacteria bacterium]|nr:MAG: phosphate ABC transporter substrate-binding protein [Pseudomonadota bacterium]
MSVTGDGFDPARRLACLPMYDIPEIARGTDRLWSGLAARLSARGVSRVPLRLTRVTDPRPVWLDNNLLMAQTCGYPFVTSLAMRVSYIGTPCYAADGCVGPRYRSWLVVHRDAFGRSLEEFRGRRAAVNSWDSLSGCKVLEMMLPRGETLDIFFSSVTISGAHASSIDQVSRGVADIASIDCVTWALLARHRPAVIESLRILDAGPLLPALPLVTAATTPAADLEALRGAIKDLLADDCSDCFDDTLIRDVSFDSERDYGEITARLSQVGVDGSGGGRRGKN